MNSQRNDNEKTNLIEEGKKQALMKHNEILRFKISNIRQCHLLV